MKNEDRLIEVMAELLAEVHEMRTDTSKQLGVLQSEIRTLQKQQAQTNIELSEMRLSIMKLADMSDRVVRLEKAVFKKAG
ncbi:MAG: hypothetical protein H6601_05260 [Flavobacteriales bacterium]|nr:hypothetical protein [Flavobacteriales bacterium]